MLLAYTVFQGSVHKIPIFLSLTKVQLQAVLKYIGNVGGNAHPKESTNLNPMNKSDTFLLFKKDIVEKQSTIETKNVEKKKFKALLNISVVVGCFVRIFLMILPLLVKYPVQTTRARTVPLLSITWDPSNSQLLFWQEDYYLATENFPIGIFYPVKLD